MTTQGYKYSSLVNRGYTRGTVIECRGDPLGSSSNGPDSSMRIHRNSMAKIPRI